MPLICRFSASVSSFHVGITDNRAEGIWLCLDATKGSYTNWYPGEPSSERKHHCARIEKLNGQWRSLSCTQYKKPFICKRSLKGMSSANELCYIIKPGFVWIIMSY